MTKGQFALLAAALGLATMGGAGYFAYASSSSHGAKPQNGAASEGTQGPGNGGALVPSNGASGADNGGAGGGGATPSASTTAGAAGSACGNTDIQVTSTDTEGAAGHISLVLVFTNISGHDCLLHGYPGASLLGQDGTDLLDATRTLAGYSGGAVGLSAAPHVLLHPNATASAVLEWSDVPTGSGANGGCAVPSPVSLAVTPPNLTQSSTVSLPAQAEVCTGFQIHPVLSGVVRTP